MEIIPYDTDNYDDFLNNIVMIHEKHNSLNGFYKIIKSTEKFFYAKKMNCQTELVEMKCNKKIYKATILNDFENDVLKKIKKTSINKTYPLIFATIVQYEL